MTTPLDKLCTPSKNMFSTKKWNGGELVGLNLWQEIFHALNGGNTKRQ